MTQSRHTHTRSDDQEGPDDTLADVAATFRLIRKWGGPAAVLAICTAVYTAWQLPRRMETVEEQHRQIRSEQRYVGCYVRARVHRVDPQVCASLDPNPATPTGIPADTSEP